MAEKKKFITPQNLKSILAGVLKTATQSVKGLMSAADKTNLDKSIKNITYFMQSGGAGLTLTKNDGTEGSLGLPVAGSTVNGLMSIADKTKLDGIASEANKYVHPTTAGNKHIPAGGSSGQILRWSADGTAAWGADNNTTYANATTSKAGLMSSADKSKLNSLSLPVLQWKEKKTVPKGTGTESGNAITFSNLTTPCLLLIANGAFSALYYINFAFESVITSIAGSSNFSINRTGSSDITISTKVPYDHTAYIIDIVKSNCP